MFNTVQVIVATTFITLLRLHIIDHESVLYLILQILFYNQQYVYDDGYNDGVKSSTVISVVTTVVAESLFAIITKNTTLSALHSTNCNSISVSIADETTSSITLSTRGTDVALKTYDTVSDLYFDTTFATTFDTAFTSTYGSLSDIDNNSNSNNKNAAAIGVMTTQVYSSPPSLPFESSNNYVALFSAVADISYESPSAAIMKHTVQCMSHSMQRDRYLLYDAVFSATVTIMTTAVTQTIISYGTCTTNNGHTGGNDIDLYNNTEFDTADLITSPSSYNNDNNDDGSNDELHSIIHDRRFSTIKTAAP